MSDFSRDQASYQALFAQYATGTIDSESLAQLDARLRVDADLRAEFVEYMNVDSAISDLAALSDTEFDAVSHEQLATAKDQFVSKAVARQRIGLGPIGYRWGSLVALIAVSVLVVATVTWQGRSSQLPPQTNDFAVEVVALEDAILSGIEGQLDVGDLIASKRIQLAAGSIKVRLGSGVVLDLFAPLDGTFQSSMSMQLTRGRLNADVGESGQGFAIVTDHGQIIDLGTRFGVDVDDVEAKVVVFDGEVKVASDSDADGASSMRVLQGDGIQLSKGQQPRRLSAVWLSQDTLSLSKGDVSSVVTNVTDNAKTEGFLRFYGVIAGGMRSGTIAYTSADSKPRRDVVWQAVAGETFPAELLGADVICPFHTDRRELSLTISLQLAGPATVFVMHDIRRSPPEWLKSGFRKTRLKISSGPWRSISPVTRGIEAESDGSFYVDYSIWKKRVDASGVIELGPPQRGGDRSNKAMYGIAVKALPMQ